MIRIVPLWTVFPVCALLLGLVTLLPNDWLVPLQMIGTLLNFPGLMISMLFSDIYNPNRLIALACNLAFSIPAGVLIQFLVTTHIHNLRIYTK